MATIICIETTTSVCSVALAEDGKCIAVKEVKDPKAHSTNLSVQVDEICRENNISINDIDAIALSKGPGSYTGLRIGTSLVKGILYSIEKPLIAIDTLQALAISAYNQSEDIIPDNALLCPMIDARRMEVYNAFYTIDFEPQTEVMASIIDSDSFSDILQERPVAFFGNGAEKCKQEITSPNAIFVDDIECSAPWMSSLAEKAFQANDFADVAYFEPFYLKEFQATTPKKNILG